MKDDQLTTLRKMADVGHYARRRIRCHDAYVLRWDDRFSGVWFVLVTKRCDREPYRVRSLRKSISALRDRVKQLGA